MTSQEYYAAKPMVAGVALLVGVAVSGFLCVSSTAGTLTITDADGTVLVNALPLTAGQWIRIPLLFRTAAGGTVLVTNGAGTLFL